MNPHKLQSASPIHMVKTLFDNRNLIIQLAKISVVARYKGSFFGLAWVFISPIVLLMIYGFVFAHIFKASWVGVPNQHAFSAALMIFSGLIFHSLLAEVLTQSAAVISSNTNYVKKVIFPLEILPVIVVVSAAFYAVINFLILFIFQWLFAGSFISTALFFPIVLMAFMPFALGLAWFFSALGVYFPDLSQTLGILATGLLFLAPIVYPMSIVPESYRHLLFYNPLTIPVEVVRSLLFLGDDLNWEFIGGYVATGVMVSCVGFFCFQKSRSGFADVI